MNNKVQSLEFITCPTTKIHCLVFQFINSYVDVKYCPMKSRLNQSKEKSQKI